MERSVIIRMICICIGCCLAGNFAGGQQLRQLKGRIVDSGEEGIPYASVAIVNQERRILSVAVCNDHGGFQLQEVPVGHFVLEVSCVGYVPGKFEVAIKEETTDLGVFILKGIELEEAVVTAGRPLVKSEVDRLVYDVENDPDAATFSSLKILNKVPFVQVDKLTDRIKVMGEEGGFAITMNGKKSLLLSESNQYVAKMIAANRLKKIELITSPDGEFSHQTAVINIVTKSAIGDGVVGEVQVRGGSNVFVNPHIGLTSRVGKFIYKLDYEYEYSDFYGSKSSGYRIDDSNENYRYVQNEDRNDPGRNLSHKIGINASYDLSPLDLITLKFNTELADERARLLSRSIFRNKDSVVTREIEGITDNKTDRTVYGTSFNYQRSFANKPGRLFTTTYNLDYRKNELQSDLLTKASAGASDTRNETTNGLDNIEHTAILDFYNPLSQKQSYYVTAKYVHRTYGSDVWHTDLNAKPLAATLMDKLDYMQQVFSFKGNYSLRTPKVMLMAEMAFEYTKNDIDFGTDRTSLKKDDKTLFASLRLTYRPAKRSSFILNMTRDVFRPDIMYLNPYEDRSIAGQIRVGNPNLDNEKKYSGMLIYNFFAGTKFSVRPMLVYRYSDHAVQEYSYTDEQGMLVTTYDNIAKNQAFTAMLGLDYTPVSWLEISLAGRALYRKFEYPGNRNDYWDQMYSLSLTSNLWKGGNFEVYTQFVTPEYAYAPNIQSPKQHLFFDGSVSLSQEFGRHIKVYVSLSDFWNKYQTQKVEKRTAEFYSYQKNHILGRKVEVSFTYNFGGFKQSVKSNQRNIGNTDRVKVN